MEDRTRIVPDLFLAYTQRLQAAKAKRHLKKMRRKKEEKKEEEEEEGEAPISSSSSSSLLLSSLSSSSSSSTPSPSPSVAPLALFSVIDGHGGHETAEYLRLRFHRVLREALAREWLPSASQVASFRELQRRRQRKWEREREKERETERKKEEEEEKGNGGARGRKRGLSVLRRGKTLPGDTSSHTSATANPSSSSSSSSSGFDPGLGQGSRHKKQRRAGDELLLPSSSGVMWLPPSTSTSNPTSRSAQIEITAAAAVQGAAAAVQGAASMAASIVRVEASAAGIGSEATKLLARVESAPGMVATAHRRNVCGVDGSARQDQSLPEQDRRRSPDSPLLPSSSPLLLQRLSSGEETDESEERRERRGSSSVVWLPTNVAPLRGGPIPISSGSGGGDPMNAISVPAAKMTKTSSTRSTTTATTTVTTDTTRTGSTTLTSAKTFASDDDHHDADPVADLGAALMATALQLDREILREMVAAKAREYGIGFDEGPSNASSSSSSSLSASTSVVPVARRHTRTPSSSLSPSSSSAVSPPSRREKIGQTRRNIGLGHYGHVGTSLQGKNMRKDGMDVFLFFDSQRHHPTV